MVRVRASRAAARCQLRRSGLARAGSLRRGGAMGRRHRIAGRRSFLVFVIALLPWCLLALPASANVPQQSQLETIARAQSQAARIGRPVLASAATTESTTIFANPDGTLTATIRAVAATTGAVPPTTDTWVRKAQPTSTHSSDPYLKVGTPDGTDVGRALLQFSMASLTGGYIDVQDATLNLYETNSGSCTPTEVDVYGAASAWDSSTTWNTQPGTDVLYASATAANGFNSSCPSGWVNINSGGASSGAGGTQRLADLVAGWVNGLPNYGLIVEAASETSTDGWKQFKSAEGATNTPTLSVTYAVDNVGATCVSPSVTDGTNPAGVIDSYLYNLRQSSPTISSADIDADLARDLCLIPLGGPVSDAWGGDPTPNASNPEDMKVIPGKIYYDATIHEYYTIMKWNWQNVDFDKEVNACGCTQNDGGPDGWGTSLGPPAAIMKGWSTSWWGNWYFAGGSTHTASASGSHGVGFIIQDKTHQNPFPSGKWDLNTYHGQEVLSFLGSGSNCHTYQTFGKYGHTWPSTGVTGFGFGVWDFSIQWDHTTQHWTNAGDGPGPPATVCPH
ncbi:MAG TPA: DNRLRE domain-containing protein [Actinomycetota bacterium]|nr:DNRLRE domain-containing protein [Actinomycetota bacterium]